MQYPTLPQLTPDGVIYHNQLMGTLEAMLPPGPLASAHAPALLEPPRATCCAPGLPGLLKATGT